MVFFSRFSSILTGVGNERGKTLTFGKQNYSHGHVDVRCINFHSFVLAIREDGEQRQFGPGEKAWTLSTNFISFYVSAMSNNIKFEF